MLPRWTAAVARLGVVALLAGASLAARAADLASLGTWSGPTGSSVLPRLLSNADIDRYEQLFTLQAENRWSDADRVIRRLSDQVLLGHVLAERYLSPGYHASYAELASWLKRYGDHPGAEEIYALAQKRKPRGVHPPKPTSPAVELAGDTADDGGDMIAHDRRARALEAQVLGAAQGGDPERAERLLERSESQALFDPAEYDAVRTRLAATYLYQGKTKKARKLAAKARSKVRPPIGETDWVAGLAAWRDGDYAAAKLCFHNLARSQTASAWMVSAGGYWAARAAIRAGQPEQVTSLLQMAAVHPRTFYGLLAAHELGEDLEFAWELPPLDGAAAAKLLAMPAAQRAMALAELGRHDLAEREMSALEAEASGDLTRALLGLASRLDMAHLQMRLGKAARNAAGRRYDSTMYPLPAWQPDGGFNIDRALIFALMRQESSFNARATSRAGARGLMQLMPKTASLMAEDDSLHRKNRGKLYAPELNVKLGQQYVAHLIDQPYVGGNLFLIMAAYNGGPGNLIKWLNSLPEGDPLLFIETIPNRETRGFVERVTANYWIYRHRLGQDLVSLDDVAGGHWPRYLPEDTELTR